MAVKTGLEERMAKIEGILEQVDKRIGSMENRLNRLEDRLNRLETRLQAQFRWMLGILITMWVTIILTVILR